MALMDKIFANPFLVQFSILTFLGFWYIETENKWKKATYSVYRFFSVFSITLVMAVEIIDVMTLNKNSTKNAERLCAATITCMIAIRTYMTFFNAQKFVKLQEKLTDFREMELNNLEKFDFIEESSNHIMMITRIFFSSAISVVIWTLIPVMEADRRLPFPLYLPLDIYKSPIFEILYIYLSLLLYTFTVSVISNTLGYCSLMIQINSHFDLVRKNLESIAIKREEAVLERRLLAEISAGKKGYKRPLMTDYWKMEDKQLKDETTREILKEIIQIQNYIYEEVSHFKQLYNITLLVHITGVLFVVAVVEITGVDENFTIQLTKRIFYISVGAFDVLIICYYGETMKHKSTEIIHAIYMTPWQEMEVGLQKMLIVMTLRALRPSVIKAGDTIRLDLATFLNIMRVAYNFVVLLRQTVY